MKQKPVTNWDQLPVILDTAMVARVLGIHQEVARLKCHSGEIPARKCGKDWRVSKKYLQEYFEGSPASDTKEVAQC